MISSQQGSARAPQKRDLEVKPWRYVVGLPWQKLSQISPKTPLYIGGREGRRQPQNLKVWPKLEVEESYSNPTWSRIPPSHLETLSTLCFFPSQTLWALVGTYSSPLGAGLSLPIAHETPWGVTPLPMVPGTPPGTPGTLPMSPKLFR